ncbi:MAG: ribonuclease HI [Gammaproteobacteria bacterium]|jgi:ribonuclease HI
MEDFDLVKNLEIELTKPETRSNSLRLAELISDDFEEFGSSRKSYNKEEILNLLQKSTPISYDLSNFSFKMLELNTMLVKYESISNGIKALRSSIWIKQGEDWKILHHQATNKNDAT